MSLANGPTVRAPIVSVEDAREIVMADATALATERVRLNDARGRVTSGAVTAGADVPGFDSSAMDGFAVRTEDVHAASRENPVGLTLVGESRAGLPWTGLLGAGEATGISTGAMVPEGADAILRLENVAFPASGIVVSEAVRPGHDIRRRGEVTRVGDLLVDSGVRLGLVEMGLLATAGCGLVNCGRRPSVAVLSSGDELVEPGSPLEPGQIWNSNSYVISELVRDAGGEVVRKEKVADRRESTRDALKRAFDSDLVLICGGVSVGDHDHVQPALAELGVQPRFRGIDLNPGRPAWYGIQGETKVLALPGNPVSAVVVFLLLADPMIRALCGERPQSVRTTGRLAATVIRHESRTRAVLSQITAEHAVGNLLPVAQLGSHDFISLREARCFALIPPGSGRAEAGEVVETMSFGSVTDVR